MPHENLAAALAAFQAEAPRVAKDKTAKVPTKAGGQYSYQYADLADIAAAAYPLLAKHGLSFACLPEIGERGMALRGVLLHTSGERLDGVLPLHGGGTPQEVGSALTYARRYLLGAMTGIVTDTDDDGQLAQSAAKAPRLARQAPPSPSPRPGGLSTDADGADFDTGELMNDRTRGRLFALLTERGITDPQIQRDGIARVIGRPIASRSELTEAEARQVITSLERKPA